MEAKKQAIANIVREHRLDPVCGAREASFLAFVDWALNIPTPLLTGKGLDVVSLVETFDADLREFANLKQKKKSRTSKKGKKKNAI